MIAAPPTEDKAVTVEEVEDGSDSGEEGRLANGEQSTTVNPSKKKKKKPKKKKAKAQQTDPPRIGLSKFFKEFAAGPTEPYLNDNAYRTTNEELRAKEREAYSDPSSQFNYASIRKAAEVHRQVRTYARQHIKPGMRMTEIAEMIEDAVRALAEEDPEDKLKAGVGFPTGLSRNHVAAHYTPNPGDKNILQAEDILKVDIGVQVGGRICDSAFTMSFKEDYYKELLTAVREATTAGVKTAGIDVRVCDIGAAVEEVMSSYEVTMPGVNGGLPMQVKPIRTLSGHNIEPYQIHGGKSVPIINNSSDQTKMEEGEYFAIETFGSVNGYGRVFDTDDCSHYAKIAGVGKVPLKLNMAKSLLNTINKEFGTLPFCRRYLDRVGETKHLLGLRSLVENGIVNPYPPLADKLGSMTAQFEHTIILRPTCKEIVSKFHDDPDY